MPISKHEVFVVASRPYAEKVFDHMFYFDEESARKEKNIAENDLFEGCCHVYRAILSIEELLV